MEKEKNSTRVHKVHVLIFLLFILIYGSSSIVIMGSACTPSFFNVLRYILVGLGFFLLIYLFLRKKQQWPKFRSYLSFYIFFIWLLFGCTIFISEMTHHFYPHRRVVLIGFCPHHLFLGHARKRKNV